jgi:hypothetical protein
MPSEIWSESLDKDSQMLKSLVLRFTSLRFSVEVQGQRKAIFVYVENGLQTGPLVVALQGRGKGGLG